MTSISPQQPARRGKRRWANAASDFAETLKAWRLWTALGGNDIAQRYRRSTIGQFWITLSMLVFIATIGSVFALLFRTNLHEQLPHVVVFYTAWSFMSQSLLEGGNTFVEAERYLRQERLPKLAFVFRVVWRNVLAYLHNLVLVPLTFLVFAVQPGPVAFTAIAGFAFILVNVSLAVVIVAVLCTRFRDLRQIVQSLVQIAFFASPIMWRQETLPAHSRLLIELNPVAAHLQLLGEPLLGQAPDPHLYIVCGACTILLAVIAIPLFVRFRERLVYWL